MTSPRDPGSPVGAFSGSPPPAVVNDFHRYGDVDAGPQSHHHTLGPNPDQAAPGNHDHIKLSSIELLKLPRGIKAFNAHPGTGDLGTGVSLIATVQFTAEESRCYKVTWKIGVPDDQQGTSGVLNGGIDSILRWAAGSAVSTSDPPTIGGVSRAPLNGNSSSYAVSLNAVGLINNPAKGLITVGGFAAPLVSTLWRVLGSHNLLMVEDVGPAI
jgi:hypothetical protein